jgi:hypothetical protein
MQRIDGQHEAGEISLVLVSIFFFNYYVEAFLSVLHFMIHSSHLEFRKFVKTL